MNVERPPRRGSFEISIATSPTEERQEIWSGLNRKPRAQKFPPINELTEAASRVLGLNAVKDMEGENDAPKDQTEQKEVTKSGNKRKRSI